METPPPGFLRDGSLSKSSNCEIDGDYFLLKPSDYYNKITQSLEQITDDHSYSLPNSSNEVARSEKSQAAINQLDSLESNAVAYLAGYLVNKFTALNTCTSCKNLLTSSMEDQVDNSNFEFIRQKQYSALNANEGLTAPSVEFVKLTKSLVDIITENLNILSPYRISNQTTKLCLSLLSNHYHLTCGKEACKNTFKTIAKLLIKVKIHFAIKQANQALKQPKNPRNKKLLKVSHL